MIYIVQLVNSELTTLYSGKASSTALYITYWTKIF